VPELSDRAWYIAAGVIMAIGALLRLWALGVKPMHHDESVNGNFMTSLVRESTYQYDPQNYHGPTLYYFSLLIERANGFLHHSDGLSEASLRLLTAIFGIATVWLILCMRKSIGKRGTLFAAALVAVSPGAVYYSRDFIHETLFIFFTLAIVVCVQLALESLDPAYLVVAAGSAALLFATKETAPLSLGAIAGALVVQRFWVALRSRQHEWFNEAIDEMHGWLENTAEALGGPKRLLLYGAISFVVFSTTFVLFFTSFFHNRHGFIDAFLAYKYWFHTGVSQTLHPYFVFFVDGDKIGWLPPREWVTLLVSLIGIVVVTFWAPESFAFVTAVWGVALFAAYTAIKYKTPWLALNATIPLSITAGYGVAYVWERARGVSLTLVRLCGGVFIAILAWNAYDLNFNHADNFEPAENLGCDAAHPDQCKDAEEGWIYVHTSRNIFPILNEINNVARRTKAGNDLHITVDAPEYWPLPWYLRDYKNTGYWGHIIDSDEPVILGQQQENDELTAKLTGKYTRFGDFFIRPGVVLTLWVRNDVAHD
jgi:uncharacterized protein (TIGR03663 family)